MCECAEKKNKFLRLSRQRRFSRRPQGTSKLIRIAAKTHAVISKSAAITHLLQAFMAPSWDLDPQVTYITPFAAPGTGFAQALGRSYREDEIVNVHLRRGSRRRRRRKWHRSNERRKGERGWENSLPLLPS